MKDKAIIVDLDGTLCNTEHRQHFMEQEKKDWKSFYAGIPDDKPNEWCREIIVRFDDIGIETILVTGRPWDAKNMDNTKLWLAKYNIPHVAIFARKDNDFRTDYVIKREIYDNFIEPDWDILFCIDDRKQVVDMWRSIGLTCLQCAEGNF